MQEPIQEQPNDKTELDLPAQPALYNLLGHKCYDVAIEKDEEASKRIRLTIAKAEDPSSLDDSDLNSYFVELGRTFGRLSESIDLETNFIPRTDSIALPDSAHTFLRVVEKYFSQHVTAIVKGMTDRMAHYAREENHLEELLVIQNPSTEGERLINDKYLYVEHYSTHSAQPNIIYSSGRITLGVVDSDGELQTRIVLSLNKRRSSSEFHSQSLYCQGNDEIAEDLSAAPL